ncbi:MAG: curli-like amyloid fiber formation chaperone CsgH [Hyphomonadaceae bacterium]
MNKFMLLAGVALLTACAARAEPDAGELQAPIAAAEAPLVAELDGAPEPYVAPAPSPTYAPAHYEAPDVDCSIETTRTAHGVRLEAVASSDIDGAYEFVVRKSGGGGSSDINQSGDFGVGRDQVLGEAEFNLERGASYRAELILTGADGVVCSDVRRS